MSVEKLITDNLDIWISAIKTKSASGRGSSNKLELYGIKKLRELILELGVRGKLVPQDPSDEPVEALIERIEATKQQLIKDKKLKNVKDTTPVAEELYPYPIPPSWKFMPLTGTYYPISPNGKKLQQTEIADEGVYPVIDQGQKFISGYTNEESLLIKISNDVVVFGDHTRTLKLVDFDFVAGADGTKILCPIVIEPSYFYLNLCSFDIESRGYGRHFKILNENFLAVPPLNEQKRIVAKADELMALCDQLESQTETRIEAHQLLLKTLLETLTNAKNADELKNSWQRISEHFDVLLTTEDSIDQLKQTILQLAVMGKLVKQDPNDEPASKLLERITVEKEQLIKDKKIKKQKDLASISEEVKPFLLPNSWEWCRFGALIMSFANGLYKPNKFYTDNGLVSLRMYNIQQGEIVFDGVRRVEASDDELATYKLEEGDLLINRVNSKELVGKSAIIPKHTEVLLYESMNMRAKPFKKNVSSEYLNLFLMSASANQSIKSFAKEAIGQASINQGQVSSILTPVPPLSEQIRICQKVELLFSVCESFKKRLNQNQKAIQRLAQALTASHKLN